MPAPGLLTFDQIPPALRGLLDFGKGAATAPFTTAPDLIGMGQQGLGLLQQQAAKRLFPNLTTPRFLPDASISGDPIREAVGLDPQSPYGLLGEVLSPDPGTAVKAGGLLADVAMRAADNPKGLLGAMTLLHGTKDPRAHIPRGGMAEKIEDIFDMRYVGDPTKGEGATAFGHGLYFAENPAVAGSYKPNFRELSDEAKSALDRVDNLGFDSRGEAMAAIRAEKKKGNDWTEIWDVDAKRDGQDVIDTLNAETEKAFGALFEVDIPDETVEKMLDWDAPLSEQPEVKSAMESALGRSLPGDLTGERAYRALAGQIGDSQFVKGVPGSQEAASSLLSQAGIPGIRFFDGQSRNLVGGRLMDIESTGGKYRAKVEIPNNTRSQGAPQTITWSPKFDTEAEAKAWAKKKIDQGTRNIVVFNPDDIREVKRDGELVFKR